MEASKEASSETWSTGAGKITVTFDDESSHDVGRLRARCEVDPKDGSLKLYPEDVLAAMYLHRVGHGDVRAVWGYRSTEPDKNSPWRGLSYLQIITEHRPLLTTGGDPFFTGMSLSKEEVSAAKELIEEMRSSKERPAEHVRRSLRIRGWEERGGGWWKSPNGRIVKGLKLALKIMGEAEG